MVITVIISTILTIALVFLLSIRLREKEIQTIFRLGCSRRAIAGFITAEIALIAILSIVIAGLLLFVAGAYSDTFITYLLTKQ